MNPILLSPHIDGDSTQEQLRQMKSYLYQFKEQIEMILSNIDQDNFSLSTNEMLEKVSEVEKNSKITMGNYSSQIKQLANQITLEVTRASGAESDIRSSISVLDGEVSMKVSSSDYTASVIVSKINNGSVTINANRIDLSGYVTVSSLGNGTTSINGACIDTGIINADLITAGTLSVSRLQVNSSGCVPFRNIAIGGLNGESIGDTPHFLCHLPTREGKSSFQEYNMISHVYWMKASNAVEYDRYILGA